MQHNSNIFQVSRCCLQESVIKTALFSKLALLILLAGTASALETPGKPALKFEQVQHEMAGSQISSIHQDSYGFLWVGTSSGLSRFDGMNVRNYHSTEHPASVADDYIGDIYEDRNNNLWIGGPGMVSRYCMESEEFTRYELPDTVSRLSPRVQKITEDESGTLWVTGGNHGLNYYDDVNDEFLAFNPLKTHAINTVLPVGEKTLWLTTRGEGLHRINRETGEITVYRHDPDDPHSISSDLTNTVVRDHQGQIWIGSRNGGINRLIEEGDDSVRFQRYINEPGSPKVLSNNHVYFMYVDNDGNLWVANDNGGIHLYEREKDLFYHYDSDPDDPYSLSHNSVTYLYQDAQSRLWIGTALSGLNVMDRYAIKFEHHNTRSRFSKNLNNNVIRNFQEDEKGNLWIATDGGGLNYFDRATGHFTNFRHDPYDPNSLQSDAVIGLRSDQDGSLWAGTYNGGIDLLVDESEGRFVSIGDTLPLSDDIFQTTFDIYFDRDYPYVWIAEFGRGVVRYNLETDEITELRPEREDDETISSDYVMRIFEDSRGDLWFVSLSGLSLLPREHKKEIRFRTFFADDNDPESLPANRIQQVIEDQKGHVWVASVKGLSRYNPNTNGFTTYDASDGLPSDELRSLAEDDNGHLWIGTTRGLSRFDPETESFQNFTAKDGLQGSEFSRYSSIRLSNGELAFGGLNGFNLFHPDSIRMNPHVPEVYVNGLRLFNKLITPQSPDTPLDRNMILTDSIRLSHDQNVLTFEYIGINFTRAEQNRYAYKLEGFDSDWNHVDNRRSATYTNLDPGTYHFRVKASNNDGVWNEEGASVVVTIVPPFWRTGWFYGGLGMFILLVVAAGVRLKMNRIKKRQKELEETINHRTAELKKSNEELNKLLEEKNKIYSVLAHDLRNPFMSIIGYSEYLSEKFEKDKDQESKEITGIILRASRNIFHLLENLLQWAGSSSNNNNIEMKPIDLRHIAKETVSTIGVQAQIKGITIENRVEAGLSALGEEDKIQTVLRNLISNAIKFSPESSTITISAQENSQMVVAVSDQGVGLSDEEQEYIFSVKSDNRQSGTKGEKGSGFGLMLCKEFIRQHGGRIWVESEKGKGSTFYFTLKKAN